MNDRRLLPGFCDLGCAFGEPGFEQAETIQSGLRAAARGGFSVVAMEPFTDPPIDNDAQVQLVLTRARSTAPDASFVPCELLPLASAAREKGTLSEMTLLKTAGAVGASLGDTLPRSAAFLRSVLEYATQSKLTVFVHPSEATLSEEGMVHEGDVAERLGLRGIPRDAEEIGLGILLPLVRRTGAKVHLSRLSTSVGVHMVRIAKASGLDLTADVSFRHLLRDEGAVEGFDVDHKVFPPLRGHDDRMSLWEGLLDGTIDAICSMHRPIAAETKISEFAQSPYGSIGLETCFASLWTENGKNGNPAVDVSRWNRWLSDNPRKVLGLKPANPDQEGTWWDFGEHWTPSDSNLASRSRNCPEIGRALSPVPVALRRNGHDIALP
jgi:dihydroorotase